MDSVGIAGRVWLSGVVEVERDGWIQPSLSPLRSVYQLDIVDECWSYFVLVCIFCPCFNIGWRIVWWAGESVVGGVEWNGWDRIG